MKNNTNFLMGLLCAFLLFDGISAVHDRSAWIGIIELLIAGFLSHPHLMSVWNNTGRAFFIGLIKLIKIEKNEDANS